MTSRLATIVIGSVDPRALAPFWEAALGWSVLEVEGDDEVITIGPAGGAWPVIDIVRVPERKTGQNRLHLDLRADGSTQAEEVERLLALGARHADVGQGPDVSWVVMADPDGNEFCVLRRSVQSR